MSDRMFNCAKGIWRYYCGLPGATDSLVLVLFKAAGIQADDVLDNYDNLGSVKVSNAEADFLNYVRIELSGIGPTGVNVTQDNTGNKANLDIPDQTISAAGTALSPQALAKIGIFYKPSIGASDGQCFALFLFDFPITTNGSDLIIKPNVAGLLDSA